MSVPQGDSGVTPYQTRFHTYVGRGMKQIVCELEQTPARLPDELRKQAVHIIGLGLKIPALWAGLRTLLLVLSPKMEQAGFRDEWIFFLEKALVAAEQQQDDDAQVELHLQLGRLYVFLGDLAAATIHFQQGLAMAEATGNRRNQGRCLGRLAYIACLRNELDGAAALAKRALCLIVDNDPEQARIYAVLGAVAYAQQAFEQAVVHYQQALAIWERTGNTRMIAWSLRDLGGAYRRQSKLDQAVRCYERALHCFATIDDPVHQASTRMNLGNVYLDMNRSEEALALYELALPTFQQLLEWRRLAIVYSNMGITYRRLQRCDEAVQALQRAIQIGQQLDDPLFLADTMVELGITYVALSLDRQAAAIFAQAKEPLACVAYGGDPLRDTISQYLQEIHLRVN